jgi:hypothetical protein
LAEARNELIKPFVLSTTEQRLWWTFGRNNAPIQKHNPACDVARKGHLVRDDQPASSRCPHASHRPWREPHLAERRQLRFHIPHHLRAGDNFAHGGGKPEPVTMKSTNMPKTGDRCTWADGRDAVRCLAQLRTRNRVLALLPFDLPSDAIGWLAILQRSLGQCTPTDPGAKPATPRLAMVSQAKTVQ